MENYFILFLLAVLFADQKTVAYNIKILTFVTIAGFLESKFRENGFSIYVDEVK